MKTFELTLNENDEFDGVYAISVVDSPAIESNFIALSEVEEVKLVEVDKERRILMGAVLIPDKKILRKDDKGEFYQIFFSKETVTKASQIFLKNGFQTNSTLQHETLLEGMSVVESWIKEDLEKDKSAIYGLNDPVGTWMCSVKVDNDDVWNDYVKTGKIKGFSVEALFSEKVEMKSDEELKLEQILDILIN